MKAAIGGKLGCLEHLIAKGAKLEATNNVSAAWPAAPSPLRPSPSALAARHPCCPTPSPVAADDDRVCCHRRAFSGRQHGPHAGGCKWQARLPRASHR